MNSGNKMAQLKAKKIGVLMGGMSSEREVSLKTGSAILASLKRLGMNAVGIDAGRDVCARLGEEKVDVAFIALHGRYGEDGCVQGALEMMGIPYTASGVAASAIAMNKRITKIVCQSAGVRTPAWKELKKGSSLENVTAPVVIKPSSGGSSIGVSVCLSDEQIEPAVRLAFEEDREALAEDFIEGPLITVGILGDMIFPPIEIEPSKGFYDYSNKYTPGSTTYHIPARLPQATLDEACQMTMKIHSALGCRGATRSELIVGKDALPWFLEINTIPGMTQTSLLPKAAAALGMTFDDLVLTMLMEALDDGR
ncbi:MAG: D-alanine--D-alanine ligase [Nitrospinae bacterium]|nr:D-alanine--D-alanine ligase [Nitrospinota bacterium]MBF0633816.1 D-alanine--D-alanine ligase [Nitrospinota bacterium]